MPDKGLDLGPALRLGSNQSVVQKLRKGSVMNVVHGLVRVVGIFVVVASMGATCFSADGSPQGGGSERGKPPYKMKANVLAEPD